jgi:hypothetical protein
MTRDTIEEAIRLGKLLPGSMMEAMADEIIRLRAELARVQAELTAALATTEGGTR